MEPSSPVAVEDRASPAAPSVTAVVVAHDPGPWFEDVLTKLATQDHPRLSVLVVDNASADGLAERVAEVLPDAEIHRRDTNDGYSAGANVVLERENRPHFWLLCHDDVALEPDAVRLMVEEAIRSNAALVGPKLVDWDLPGVLLAVGLGVDKTAALAPYAEPGELDQEQHDAVRDVFAIPGGVTLIRSDLFAALGGYDSVMAYHNEDVDLSWRARVAGARVLVVPDAVARHRSRLSERDDSIDTLKLRRRHQFRMLFSNYGFFHTVRVVPQAFLLSVVESVYALVTGRIGRLKAVIGGWLWNLARPAPLITRRRQLGKVRQLSDADVRRFQVGGFAPINAFLRGRVERLDGSSQFGQSTSLLLQRLRSGPTRSTVVTWSLIAVVVVFGSRHLLTRGVPAFGGFSAFPGSTFDFFGTWWTSHRPEGLGYDGAAAIANLLLGLAGLFVFGASGLLRTVLIIGLLPLGALGVWRWLRVFESRWTRVVGTVAYLAVPLPYNALANGAWAGLLAYAAWPWLLAVLARACRQAPFGPFDGVPSSMLRLPSLTREALTLGLVAGAVAAFSPNAVLMLPIVVGLLLLGGVMTGTVAGSGRLALIALIGIGLALALQLPWIAAYFDASTDLEAIVGARPTAGGPLSLGQLLRFDTGPMALGPFGWALPIVALLPLLLARSMRFAWAVRGWLLYLGSVALAWASQQGELSVPIPRPDVILVPGALGLAIAAAMGMAAFEVDLRRYRFGWRQLVPITAALALVLATFPVLAAQLDGRWGVPNNDLGTPFSFLAEDETGFRVLWIGHPDFLPATGWPIEDGVAMATTDDGLGDVRSRWVGLEPDGLEQLRLALETARAGGTSRLGGLVAPMAVRYIVVVDRLTPGRESARSELPPESITATLDEQLDLEQIPVGRGATAYRNDGWIPVNTQFPGGAIPVGPGGSFADAAGLDLTAGEAVLEGGDLRYQGPLDSGDLHTASGASRWRLDVDGARVARAEAFGWSSVYGVASAGAAELGYDTAASHRFWQLAQAAAWLVVALVVIGMAVRDRATPLDTEAVT